MGYPMGQLFLRPLHFCMEACLSVCVTYDVLICVLLGVWHHNGGAVTNQKKVKSKYVGAKYAGVLLSSIWPAKWPASKAYGAGLC